MLNNNKMLKDSKNNNKLIFKIINGIVYYQELIDDIWVIINKDNKEKYDFFKSKNIRKTLNKHISKYIIDYSKGYDGAEIYYTKDSKDIALVLKDLLRDEFNITSVVKPYKKNINNDKKNINNDTDEKFNPPMVKTPNHNPNSGFPSLIINGTNEPYINIDLPDNMIPSLTERRKRAINKQVKRFLDRHNLLSIEDKNNYVYKLVYSTLDFMPYKTFQEVMSKGLWYFSDYEFEIDKSEYNPIYRLFREQEQSFLTWHKQNGRNISKYDIPYNIERVAKGIKGIIKLQDNPDIEQPVIFGSKKNNNFIVLMAVVIAGALLSSISERKKTL